MARRRSKKKPKLADLPGLDDPKAPIEGATFLAAAQPVLKQLDKDLLARAKASPAVDAALKARHKQEKEEKRTAAGFNQWRERFVGQVGAAWLLSCVFVRVLEDRGLTKTNRIAGPGAADAQRLFFEMAPSLTERDYLLTVFRELTHYPASARLFDARHNPVWMLAPSAEAAKALLALFRTPSADTPAFRFGQESTRFLGDLYQDLDESVRKRFALLQTPDFVEAFILDRTLEPVIAKFGLDDTDLIDPTCGSGHFLLGAFDRLFEHRLRAEPGIERRQAALKALSQVAGADINPYAAAIARFRLTLSFLEKGGYAAIADAPELPIHVAVADSLLYNPQLEQQDFAFVEEGFERRAYELEDAAEAKAVLHREYAAVVGNPPYITVKDKALRDRYRALYPSAHRQYSLAVPFCERFFQLARAGGRVGQITANSFMKREFGTKLIEEYLGTVDLDLIVNTSGAYIPGHGTPTVLLFGSHQPPSETTVLSVLAKRGEPTTPANPAKGLVWTSITQHWDELEYDDDYITVSRLDREHLQSHPWSLAGGGATELKALLEDRAETTLGAVASDIGFSVITGEDNVLMGPKGAFLRAGLRIDHIRRNAVGEEVRDWTIADGDWCVWPNDSQGIRLGPSEIDDVLRFLWPYRTTLKGRKAFGVPVEEKGIPWWALREVYSDRMKTPLTIAFAEVATHNHFVLDRGGKVFKQTAPIIKLPETATEEDHLALLAYLNSSTACFYMKRVSFPKGGSGIGRGIQDELWEGRYQFDGTKMASVPLPHDWQSLTELGRKLDALSIDDDFDQMVMLQETLDWTVYRLFGLLEDEPMLTLDDTSLCAGHRPFEHALAEREPGTAWFERNDYPRPTAKAERSPITEARLKTAADDKLLALLERPEHKRRWGKPTPPEERRLATARAELLASVERTLAEAGETQANQLRGSGSVSGSPIDGTELSDLMAADAAPFLAALVFTEDGLRKHEQWRDTWRLQRQQDLGDPPATIPVPPKYARKDYRSNTYYSLRGKLDVPKERFIAYPGCESDEDGEPVYGWAGWDHEQRAKALATLYYDRKTNEGWDKDRLTPLLAGLRELQFWLDLWHNEPSDHYGGTSPAEYYRSFVNGECQTHGLTHEDLKAWRPPAKRRRGS